jgi:hypothetical protein
MELYFDRPRLRTGRVTLLSKDRKDWMWFHDHDINCTLKVKDCLYLYRDPVETIFSYCMAECNDIHEAYIRAFSKLYRTHLDKYLLGNNTKTIISYEMLKGNFTKEFKKITDHFNYPFIQWRLISVSKKVTKKSLVELSTDKKYYNKMMLSGLYETTRVGFRTLYSNMINEIIYENSDLKRFFLGREA